MPPAIERGRRKGGGIVALGSEGDENRESHVMSETTSM
jgi:hypothetical protein